MKYLLVAYLKFMVNSSSPPPPSLLFLVVWNVRCDKMAEVHTPIIGICNNAMAIMLLEHCFVAFTVFFFCRANLQKPKN